jgi:hypothetical protein
VAAGTLGEFDTDQLLKLANPPLVAGDAAAGWGGGRYAMWTRGPASAVLLRWTWDTPRDERQFVAAARRYVAARPGSALAVRGGVTTISFGQARSVAG